jgi:hypothetical protein
MEIYEKIIPSERRRVHKKAIKKGGQQTPPVPCFAGILQIYKV